MMLLVSAILRASPSRKRSFTVSLINALIILKHVGAGVVPLRLSHL